MSIVEKYLSPKRIQHFIQRCAIVGELVDWSTVEQFLLDREAELRATDDGMPEGAQ